MFYLDCMGKIQIQKINKTKMMELIFKRAVTKDILKKLIIF